MTRTEARKHCERIVRKLDRKTVNQLLAAWLTNVVCGEVRVNWPRVRENQRSRRGT